MADSRRRSRSREHRSRSPKRQHHAHSSCRRDDRSPRPHRSSHAEQKRDSRSRHRSSSTRRRRSERHHDKSGQERRQRSKERHSSKHSRSSKGKHRHKESSSKRKRDRSSDKPQHKPDNKEVAAAADGTQTANGGASSDSERRSEPESQPDVVAAAPGMSADPGDVPVVSGAAAPVAKAEPSPQLAGPEIHDNPVSTRSPGASDVVIPATEIAAQGANEQAMSQDASAGGVVQLPPPSLAAKLDESAGERGDAPVATPTQIAGSSEGPAAGVQPEGVQVSMAGTDKLLQRNVGSTGGGGSSAGHPDVGGAAARQHVTATAAGTRWSDPHVTPPAEKGEGGTATMTYQQVYPLSAFHAVSTCCVLP